ncbi:MAG TPA: type II secretion system protein [Tepidisphaeraceae bacterium]|nr:type II secretion system protein [Tepidisphaeraceae bacterium]
MQDKRLPARSARLSSGFTLIELLVVIGIITILVGILVPVASRVREAARKSTTTAFISQLSRSIDNYFNDFRDYPGPLTNKEIWNSSTPPAISIDSTATDYDLTWTATSGPRQITMAENLVLGLLGGLRFDRASSQITYDPRLVGNGANSLNAAKHYQTYIESSNLSWRSQPLKTGHFVDDADSAGAKDTIIPEFVDQYNDPMPILYLRAKRGAFATGSVDEKNNTICTYDYSNPDNRIGQYDLHQVIGYTDSKIGSGRSPIIPVGYSTGHPHGLFADNSDPIKPESKFADRKPIDPYVYFRNTSLSTPGETDTTYSNKTQRNDVPYQKDAYILISAGPDRVYGTTDDITNFGPVGGQ